MFGIQRRPLDRRTLLRAAGTCLALPFLEAMAPCRLLSRESSDSGPTGRPPRMLFCYIPNGVNQTEWAPKDAGPNWSTSPSLEVLKDFRAEMSVISGVCHAKSRGGHSGADTWLTGADLEGTPGKDYQNSQSVDQAAAEVHGRQTRFPSLELSFHGGTGSPGHSHTLSYDRIGTPLPTERNPRRVFDRLFSPEGPAAREAALRRYTEQKSILDGILDDARSLGRRLGKQDQRKLDEYLGSVREMELRLSRLREWIDVPKAEVSQQGLNLEAQPNPHDARMWLDCMLDLCGLALETDTTRIITFEWAREAGGPAANGADHHAYSHHGGDPSMLAKVAEIDRFHLEKLTRFLRRLRTKDEAGETLLARTMVLFGSGISDGSSHQKENLPLVLAGGSRLGIKHGSHLKFDETRPPFANVLLTMLQAMGIERSTFADGTGTLAGLI
jgi:hypothetical protein